MLNVKKLQAIRDKILGVTSDPSKYGDLNSVVYLQQILDAVQGITSTPSRVRGNLNEKIYLQKILNAKRGVVDGQFGSLSNSIYLQQLINAYNGVADKQFGSLSENSYLDAWSAVAASTNPVVYLFRDEFTTAQGAPVASPRAAEPGPGITTLVQADGQFSISAGKLNVPAQASAVWGDLSACTDIDVARTGLCLALKPNASSLADGAVLGLGNGGGTGAASILHALYLSNNAANYFSFLTPTWALAPFLDAGVLGATYSCYVIARPTTGCFLVVGTKMLYVSDLGNTATLRGKFTNKKMVGTVDDLKLVRLPAPWNTDYGIATQRLAGNRSAGDVFVHIANALIAFTVTTRPVAGNVDFRFRIQDATNYWQVTIDSTGALTLNEVVGGGATLRATAAGVIVSGHSVLIVADGTTIKAYSNDTLRWTYASAVNFATSTNGLLFDEGTGGSISEIVSWPRQISGSALTILNFI